MEKAFTPSFFSFVACCGVAHLIFSMYLYFVTVALMLFLLEISWSRLSVDLDRRLLSTFLHTTVQLALSSGDSTRSKPPSLSLIIKVSWRSSLR